MDGCRRITNQKTEKHTQVKILLDIKVRAERRIIKSKRRKMGCQVSFFLGPQKLETARCIQRVGQGSVALMNACFFNGLCCC